MRRLLSLIPLVLFLLAAPALAAMEQGRVTIRTAGGAEHVFTVEIARSLEEQQRGLMFRESLAPEAGMLFPYDAPQPLAFWMKNTLIPLDMIFIGSDGRILNIETAKPHDLTPVTSRGEGTAVLEIQGGLSAKLGIRAGDLVVHPHFSTTSR